MRKRINNVAKWMLGAGAALWVVIAIGYHYWRAGVTAATVRAGELDASHEYVLYHVPLWLRLLTVLAIALLIGGAVSLVPGGSEKPAPKEPGPIR